MKILSLFVALCCVFTLHATPALNTRIKGQIEHPSTRYVSLEFFTDMVSMEEAAFTVPLDAQGRFLFEFDLDKPMPMTLVYGNQRVALYIAPNDKLSLQWTLPNAPTFPEETPTAIHNSYLTKQRSKFVHLEPETLIHTMKQMSPKRFKHYLDFWYEEQHDFMQAYLIGASAHFKSYAKYQLQYWRGYQLLRQRWEYPLAQNLEAPMPLPKTTVDFLLHTLSPQEDQALIAPNYIYYLDQYLDFKKDHHNRPQLSRSEAARQFLHGKSMFYILSNELYMKTQFRSIEEVEHEIHAFFDENPHKDLNQALRQAYTGMFEIRQGQRAPNFELLNQKGETVTLQDFKGKIIYMDFWASWCFSCIKDMKEGPDLSATFDQSDIVFLYISLDDNPNTWTQTLQRHALNQKYGTHLYAPNGYESDIVQHYNIRSVPSFFIIDKQGRLAEIQALSPSHAGMVAHLKQLLNE